MSNQAAATTPYQQDLDTLADLLHYHIHSKSFGFVRDAFAKACRTEADYLHSKDRLRDAENMEETANEVAFIGNK